MKISHMIKREDFYSINEKTLRSFYRNAKKTTPLYVYPELNAIVVKKPSRAVKQYLYTEYQVSGSFWKRVLAQVYCKILLNSRGLFAAKKIQIPNDANDNTLIYPCNRKYRIFDFENDVVYVIGKDGFSKTELQNEIFFRKNHSAAFIPELLQYDENGYSEFIIKGYPVARAGAQVELYSRKAYDLWKEYASAFKRTVSGKEYSQTLKDQTEQEITHLKSIGKEIDYTFTEKYSEWLSRQIEKVEKIPLTLSHGDFQAGNIWIERETEKVFIIDWESCTERSEYYDASVLFDKIRYTKEFKEFIAKETDEQKIIVLAEDFLFRLKELASYPEQFGRDDFAQYISKVEAELCLKN